MSKARQRVQAKLAAKNVSGRVRARTGDGRVAVALDRSDVTALDDTLRALDAALAKAREKANCPKCGAAATYCYKCGAKMEDSGLHSSDNTDALQQARQALTTLRGKVGTGGATLWFES